MLSRQMKGTQRSDTQLANQKCDNSQIGVCPGAGRWGGRRGLLGQRWGPNTEPKASWGARRPGLSAESGSATGPRQPTRGTGQGRLSISREALPLSCATQPAHPRPPDILRILTHPSPSPATRGSGKARTKAASWVLSSSHSPSSDTLPRRGQSTQAFPACPTQDQLPPWRPASLPSPNSFTLKTSEATKIQTSKGWGEMSGNSIGGSKAKVQPSLDRRPAPGHHPPSSQRWTSSSGLHNRAFGVRPSRDRV